MMKNIKSATIGRLHELAVDAVMKYGKKVVTENDDRSEQEREEEEEEA